MGGRTPWSARDALVPPSVGKGHEAIVSAIDAYDGARGFAHGRRVAVRDIANVRMDERDFGDAASEQSLQGIFELIAVDVDSNSPATPRGDEFDGSIVVCAIAELTEVVEVLFVARSVKNAARTLERSSPILQSWQAGVRQQEQT